MEIGCALEKDWIMKEVRRETVVCRRRMRVAVLDAIFWISWHEEIMRRCGDCQYE
jgi:hypothetical protein